jgi:shikimate dehydrogenase
VRDGVRGLVALGFRGANVTVPHKEAVLPYLDATDPAAEMLGAVNTLVIDRPMRDSPTVTGYNTDVPGFLAALKKASFEPIDKRAVVVGAGGAARAVVAALLTARAAQVTVLNRTLDRATRLVSELTSHVVDVDLKVAPLKALVEVTWNADLLVNATPVGMMPNITESVWPGDVPLPSSLVVFDLVYAPLQTRLLQQVKESGAHAIDGLGMLIHQGALAFTLWTGGRHDLEEVVDVMAQALTSTNGMD